MLKENTYRGQNTSVVKCLASDQKQRTERETAAIEGELQEWRIKCTAVEDLCKKFSSED